MTEEGRLSFAAQALHYFDRPHDAMPEAPLAGPAAWRGEDLARSGERLVRLDDRAIAELDALRGTLRERGRRLETLRQDDVALPTLASRIAAWRRELVDRRTSPRAS